MQLMRPDVDQHSSPKSFCVKIKTSLVVLRGEVEEFSTDLKVEGFYTVFRETILLLPPSSAACSMSRTLIEAHVRIFGRPVNDLNQDVMCTAAGQAAKLSA